MLIKLSEIHAVSMKMECKLFLSNSFEIYSFNEPTSGRIELHIQRRNIRDVQRFLEQIELRLELGTVIITVQIAVPLKFVLERGFRELQDRRHELALDFRFEDYLKSVETRNEFEINCF
jgi:hypothetical protein